MATTQSKSNKASHRYESKEDSEIFSSKQDPALVAKVEKLVWENQQHKDSEKIGAFGKLQTSTSLLQNASTGSIKATRSTISGAKQNMDGGSKTQRRVRSPAVGIPHINLNLPSKTSVSILIIHIFRDLILAVHQIFLLQKFQVLRALKLSDKAQLQRLSNKNNSSVLQSNRLHQHMMAILYL